MKELVIFCESYSLIRNCLYLATLNYRKRPINIVIPGNSELFKFFGENNEKFFSSSVNIIYFEAFEGRRTTGNTIAQMVNRTPEIIREKRYLREVYSNYLAHLKGAEIYFFVRQIAQVSYYFLEKLSKGNRLVYMESEAHVLTADEHPPASLMDLVSLMILKLVYGRELSLIRLGGYPRGAPYIADSFIDRKVDKVIDVEEGNRMMKDFDLSQFKIFDTSIYSIIYFDDSLIASGLIEDRNVFKRELAGIFEIVSKYFPEKEIARKYHPRYPKEDKTVIEVGDVLPDFIPAELLYNENVVVYLSVASNSIINVEGGAAVSLIDLVTLNSADIADGLRESLIQRSSSEILFPQTLDEFEGILVDLKGQREMKR
ncbi:MAG: hypothetical protein CL876_02760 [Dehalococcoidales bacterium]|nr:hypothetical protein [Dehalococcoidales bacterium]